ncbi:hypothetical protein HDZ31DRAFT_40930 [Schizophyllum fasciatum]
MNLYGDYRGDHSCPISGATDKLTCCTLMLDAMANEDEAKIVRTEWAFGLPRGGFSYFLQSRDNYVPFREDISKMFCRGEFILAPTYKTYLDTMLYASHAGIKDRKDNDRSPRRPPTAMASPAGLYRYVFLPFTDAARALQDEFDMQPQTNEDLNNGIFPLGNKPYRAGSDRFPVIECHAHPFAISVNAWKTLWRRSTSLTGQWHNLTGRIISIWMDVAAQPPQWFFDSPKYAQYDEDLTHSEATGYDPIAPDGLPKPEPISILQNLKLTEDSSRRKAAKWTVDVGPDADPPEDEPPRVVYAVRRSRRIQERAHPYRSSPSPSRSGPLRSPTRNAARALLTCKRNPVKNPPSWASQNGRYPSHRFSSNDWAYFRYNVYLATSIES